MCFASEAQNDTMHTQGTAREMRTESFALRGEIHSQVKMTSNGN